MGVYDSLAQGFSALMTRTGEPISIKYYSSTIGSVYDDDSTLTTSGTTLWTSGIILALDFKRDTNASSDYFLVEQGKLDNHDQRLYLNGSVALTTPSTEVKIGVGSPNREQYSIISLGVIPHEVQGSKVMKKVYIRKLETGSLLGE